MKNSQQPHCPMCHVAVGQYHRPNCKAELCPYCGLFLIAKNHRHGCPQSRSQCWPPPLDDRIPCRGVQDWIGDCLEFGWMVRPVARKMVRCAKGDPGAQPDFMRLLTEATWDTGQQRFVQSLANRLEETCPSTTLRLLCHRRRQVGS
jgi:hypothetical protein